MGQLTVARIKTLREPGRYVDGDGLMLLVKASGAQSWMLRVRIKGDRRDIGLGSTKVMTLAEARAKAIELRRQIAQGIDPIAEKKKVEDPVPTFADAARRVHAEQKATWKNGKHQVQWIKTLETYAFPFFGDNLVNAIEGPHIRQALLPIWLTKPETARRVRQRVGAVLDWSYVNGYHLLRLYLRTGRVFPTRPAVVEALTGEPRPARRRLVMLLRESVDQAMRDTAHYAGLDVATLNYLEWQLARTICVSELGREWHPHCLAAPSWELPHDVARLVTGPCPFGRACRTLGDRGYEWFNQPQFEKAIY